MLACVKAGPFSSGMDDSLPQEIKTCTTKHLSLDQLQPIDLTFHLSIASGKRKCHLDRGIVRLQPFGEYSHFSSVSRLDGSLDPSV